MKRRAEPSASVWMATSHPGERPPLTRDARADVCIVGAGIAGLTTAYLLAKEGRFVIVLDDGPIAGGQTQRTTAHLASALDDRYFELEKIHGQEGIQIAAESHATAIDRIEAIVQEEGIDCDFERLDGYLFAAPGQSLDVLEQELAAARRAGLPDLELVPRAPLATFDTGTALRFPRQAQFHPLKYLSRLAEAIEELGGQIFCRTHVKSVEGGARARVGTEQGPTVDALSVVVATNTPINDMFAIHTKQAPYLTYAIGARIPADSVTRALYWDTLDPYHYARLQSNGSGDDTLIVGGEDHKAGQSHEQEWRWTQLERWTRERFPMLEEVEYCWSGLVMETTDGLAFIGPNPGDKENVFIATGDSGMGMTHGAIAGIILSDLTQCRTNPWSKLYDPSRKPVWGMAWREYVAENLNVAAQYVKDWLSGGEVASVEEIAPGTGALLRDRLTKVAVHRDDAGNLHRRSALCPHLGCIVHWNSAEKTWDCPCHGSRFDARGGVINGPANTPLAKAD